MSRRGHSDAERDALATSTAQEAATRGALLPILLLCGLALLLRLYGLGTNALWSDEIYRLTWSKGYDVDRVFGVLPDETGVRQPTRPVGDAFSVVSRHTPPLYPLILNLWLWLVGDAGDFLVRLPSALLSAGAILVLYLAVAHRFGRAPAAFAAGFAALSPIQFVYAQEANHYALAFFCICSCFYFYFRLLASRSLLDGALWSISALAACYAHYHSGLVVLFQGLGLVWPYRLSWRTWLPSALLVALGLAPYLPHLRRQLPELTTPLDSGAFLGAPYFWAAARAHVLQPFLGPFREAERWLIAAPILALSALLVLLALRGSAREDRRGLLLLWLGPILAVYTLFWVEHLNAFLWARYQFLFGTPFIVMVGLALGRLGRGARWALSVLLVVILAAANVRRAGLVDPENWHAVADAIERQAVPGEPVVVFPASLTYSLARYVRNDLRLFGFERSPELETLLRSVLELPGHDRGAWYVSARTGDFDTGRRLRSTLEASYLRCEPERVPLGSVSFLLLHCLDRRALLADPGSPTGSDRGWWRSREGPRVEAGWIEMRNRTSVRGWAWSTGGLRAVRVVRDGRTLAEFPHPGLPRPDVAFAFPAVPAEVTGFSGFLLAIGLGDGDLTGAQLFGVRADETLMEIASP